MIKKCVIVTPVSLIDNWDKEIKKWLGDNSINPLIARTDRSSAKSIIKNFE